MSHDCFVCLSNCTNKVCTTCKCYAHARCWGSYLKNYTDVLTYIYHGRIIINTPLYTNCPQCRSKIFNVKPTTRSDTVFGRKFSLATQFRNMLFAVEITPDIDTKLSIFSNIFNIIARNKNLIRNEFQFKNIIKKKLRFLYMVKSWKPANLYHLKIFGKQI